MSLAGFDHVFTRAVEVNLPGGIAIRVAPPIVTALLKIIAWVDAPYQRAKDLQDIRIVLRRYERDSGRLFSEDVFDAELPDFEFANAFLLGLDPELLWARFYLARLYFDQGLTEKAQEQLERGLKQRPGLPNFLSLLGEVRRELGDPAASLDLNHKALEAGETMTPVHYFLALAHQDLKQEQAAIAEFEKAINSPYVTPEMYNALASLYIKKQQFAAAEALCRKAIAMDRTRPDAYLNLARIYNARHASDFALEALRTALPQGREFPASEYYQQLQADLAVERGVAYTAKKMYARATEEYIHALDFDPGRAAVHRRLAELFLQKGDPTGAALHTKEADKLQKVPK